MAAHTSQSVAKAAGDVENTDDARGRSRWTDSRATGRSGGGLGRALATHWYAWAMVAPVVLVLGVIIGWPLVRGVYLSLTDANERNVGRTIGANHIEATYQFVGLDNYADVLTDPVFLQRLVWTVTWTVLCVSITFTLGLVLANMLNREFRGRAAYRMALILPWAVPGFVSVFAWRFLFNRDNGILNKLLDGGGISAIPWLDDPTWAKVAVISVNVWLGVPFMMVALLGGLQSIPGELYEAAEMDGASAWQRFRHITVPGLRSVSMTVILLSTIWTFNMFPVIFLLTRGGPGDATEILVTQAFKEAFISSPRDFAGSATWGVLILALLMIFALVYRRSLRKQGEVW
ncbi:sugar ABC transporter permease [Streptomyces goshikiensis]|uniref:Sugar ABC transporter permease n=2 Tax=Streptomyces goshikiensis TaxID=1942 RepID=A0ABZ1RQE6_9ACTN|nr:MULTISPECIES: sugar ABC transporter permease [Streptomyces]AKL65911.1 ABC transporter permease [Streptomyces sp. Mg1]OKI41152.1 ABC transporter permease [Streptomyces sp. CB03578]PJN14098.1 sugar ABC transporter permease [Streptomyces sp. CB02120-2]RPK53295.1 Inner membrane ABC transporter permease protein YcjO [Streptomyces sp. ADI91-18]WBY19926.1 sugar ABC transporter permease [Streptomyces goshikiensis]